MEEKKQSLRNRFLAMNLGDVIRICADCYGYTTVRTYATTLGFATSRTFKTHLDRDNREYVVRRIL